eukprot:TRINITY_DN1493_c0_g2_i1.p1 TRINITY_DN1493_c0_g2~~TRINITY_DN1493_c0_g2_i1.p1  ORF type:complete len:272 (+),score=35.69 TRINITY_DN1493_c0_g2_i1:67-816(+)
MGSGGSVDAKAAIEKASDEEITAGLKACNAEDLAKIKAAMTACDKPPASDSLRTEEKKEENTEDFQLQVVSMAGEQFDVPVNASTTVSELCAKVKAFKIADRSDVMLTFGDVVLEAGTATLDEYGIKSGSMVSFVSDPATWSGLYSCSVYADYSDYDHPVFVRFEMDVGREIVRIGDVTGKVAVTDDAGSIELATHAHVSEGRRKYQFNKILFKLRDGKIDTFNAFNGGHLLRFEPGQDRAYYKGPSKA